MGESFFQNWGEYVVGIPALVISIVASIWIYFKQNKKKELSYYLKWNELISYEDGIKEELEVFYKGEKIKNLSSIIIEFINSGNAPILKTDFEEKIKAEIYGDEVKIISAEVQGKQPNNLDIEVVIKNEREIVIGPCLLNQKDRFTIILLTNSISKKEFNIDARIIGVKGLTELKSNWNNPIFQILLGVNSIAFAISSYYIGYSPSVWTYSLFGALLLTGFLILILMSKKTAANKGLG